jgi:hypothetical protein
MIIKKDSWAHSCQEDDSPHNKESRKYKFTNRKETKETGRTILTTKLERSALREDSDTKADSSQRPPLFNY